MGRSDDMMVIKGVNVFPSQIETVLLKRGYQANYQIIVDRKGNNDTCLVKVELTPEMAEDTIRSNEAREKELVSKLKSMLGIRVDVKVVPPKSIERSEGKAVRVIDKRNPVSYTHLNKPPPTIFTEITGNCQTGNRAAAF